VFLVKLISIIEWSIYDIRQFMYDHNKRFIIYNKSFIVQKIIYYRDIYYLLLWLLL